LEKITDLLNVLTEDPEKIEGIIKGITTAFIALGAVKIGAGVVSFIANLKGIQGGNINFSGMGSGGAGIPVHVTNWGGVQGSSMSAPGKILPTGVTGLDPKANNAALMKSGAIKGGLLATAATGMQQGIGAYQRMKAINADTEMSIREKEKAKGGTVGSAVGTTVGTGAGVLAGALLAGKVGAMIGTALAPGVGTAIGGAIGMAGGALVGWIGGKAGKKVGEEIGDIAGAMAEKKVLRNEINSVPTLPSQTPINAVLEGNAVMDVNVNINDEGAQAKVFLRKNTTLIDVNLGLAREARGLAL
jgi:hypothetical protein